MELSAQGCQHEPQTRTQHVDNPAAFAPRNRVRKLGARDGRKPEQGPPAPESDGGSGRYTDIDNPTALAFRPAWKEMHDAWASLRPYFTAAVRRQVDPEKLLVVAAIPDSAQIEAFGDMPCGVRGLYPRNGKPGTPAAERQVHHIKMDCAHHAFNHAYRRRPRWPSCPPAKSNRT